MLMVGLRLRVLQRLAVLLLLLRGEPHDGTLQHGGVRLRGRHVVPLYDDGGFAREVVGHVVHLVVVRAVMGVRLHQGRVVGGAMRIKLKRHYEEDA